MFDLGRLYSAAGGIVRDVPKGKVQEDGKVVFRVEVTAVADAGESQNRSSIDC